MRGMSTLGLLALSFFQPLAMAVSGGDSKSPSCSITALSQSALQGGDMAFSYTVKSHADAAKVWAVWMDVPGWPRWDTELREARSSVPLALGVTGTLTPSNGLPSDFKVTVFEDRHRYAFETALPMAALTVDRQLRPLADGGTELTHTVSFTGKRAAEFATRFAPSFRAAFPRAVAGVARLAEGCVEVKP